MPISSPQNGMISEGSIMAKMVAYRKLLMKVSGIFLGQEEFRHAAVQDERSHPCSG